MCRLLADLINELALMEPIRACWLITARIGAKLRAPNCELAWSSGGRTMNRRPAASPGIESGCAACGGLPGERHARMEPHRYRIIVSGAPGELTRHAFDDLCVESDGADTWLTGELDQAGLFGVLNRIMDFGLELIALSRLEGP